MKSLLALSSFLLLGAVAAQEVQSKPFHLVITAAAKKKSYNGQELAACHTGAAIESLCLAGTSGSEFYLNTTKGEEPAIKGEGLSGTLLWNLPYNGGMC
ncbi:hypothetical protein N7540_010776 [Penicillium herquei]|nr:hypothetical protein N7540_010776 [Penicillium herquei]